MIWVDWVLIAIVGLSVLVGLWRGFIREVFSVAVWVLAIWVAFRYSGIAAGWLEAWVDLPSARAIIGFVGLLVITLMIGGLAGWLLGRLVDSTGLGGTDRMIGMLFGILRGLVMVVVIVLVARFTPFPEDPWWKESRLLPYFERLAEHSVQWLPQNLQDMLENAEADQPQSQDELLHDLLGDDALDIIDDSVSEPDDNTEADNTGAQ